METVAIVTTQTIVMFLLMAVGYLLFRFKKISVESSKGIAAMILWAVFPAVIIQSFCVERTAERMAELGQSFIICTLALGLSVVVAHLLFRQSPIDDFGAAFSNAGFIGIPLVTAALGSHAVFYIVWFVALLNILQFSYGVALMTGKKEPLSLKTVFGNPIVDGTLVGLLIFLSGMGEKLPAVASKTLSYISGLNAPLAMIVLGVYLAQSDFKKLFTTPKLYWVSFVRLLLIPALTILLLWALPFESDMKMAVLLAACAPIGANVAVYAQLNGQDYGYACQTVCLSTILSIAAVPLVVLAGSMVF